MGLVLNTQRVTRLDLFQHDIIDGSLELLYFGLQGLTRKTSYSMAVHDLTKIHHLILFVVARRDGVVLSELCASFGMTPADLYRPVRRLRDIGFIATTRDPLRTRCKVMRITARGRQVESEASEAERKVMRDAFEHAGDAAASGWASVMTVISKSA